MARINLTGGSFYYQEAGTGVPLIFIHGVTMGSRFFERQLKTLSKSYRVITIDLRGHGRSVKSLDGHTVENYARDIHQFMAAKDLTDVVLFGWSMGAFVLWEYVRQFGTDNLIGTVVIDQTASDFKWDDYPLGLADTSFVAEMVRLIQEDYDKYIADFLPILFKEMPSPEDQRWMYDEISRVPPVIASTIWVSDLIRDSRDILGKIDIPTLVCIGRHDEVCVPEAVEDVADRIAGSKKVYFENSGHCPFLEETEVFNREIDVFLKSL